MTVHNMAQTALLKVPCRIATLLYGLRQQSRAFRTSCLTDFGFAAEIHGADFAELVSDDSINALKQAFKRYSVLVVRGAHFDDAMQVQFTKHLVKVFQGGSVENSLGPTVLGRSSGDANVLLGRIANFDPETGRILPEGSRLLKLRSGNGLWHIDSSFRKVPAIASVMTGRTVPPASGGGSTEFASTRAAFEELPYEEQSQLMGKVVVHDFCYSLGLTDRKVAERRPWHKPLPPSSHMLVRSAFGARALYVGKHCSHVEGMDLGEGRRLIRRLNRHVTQPRFIYEHRWAEGDAVICDNRACVHRGRTWQDPSVARRMLCLSKVAEAGHHREMCGQQEVGEAAEPPSLLEARLMLRAVGLDDMAPAAGSGVLYFQPKGLHALPRGPSTPE